MLSGHLDEIFYSIQGEGAELGRPHLFCRFGGCPLRCVYCDTPRSWQQQAQYELHYCDTTQRFDNPVSVLTIVDQLSSLLEPFAIEPSKVCLSLTGGEVLQQPEFAEQIAKAWPGRVLLETSGSSCKPFDQIASSFDMVSLDWKTPSLMSNDLLSEHKQCLLSLAHLEVDSQVKLVVAATTTDDEVYELFDFLLANKLDIPIYLQPLTKVALSPAPPTGAQMLKWLTKGAAQDLNVRVVPQVHPILQAR
jgi:organic radical activating enzyme